MLHLALNNAKVIDICKLGCLSMKSVYHFILGLLLMNLLGMFNLVSSSSTLSRTSDCVSPYPILAMCVIHFSILSLISSGRYILDPFFCCIGVFPFSLSQRFTWEFHRIQQTFELTSPAGRH